MKDAFAGPALGGSEGRQVVGIGCVTGSGA
jgi:hypothetical protein